MRSLVDETGELQTNVEEVELHAQELQHIITTPPAWLIQWGIGIIFCIFLAFFAASVFIKYPDKIELTMNIISTNNFAGVNTKSRGQISDILVTTQQKVDQGQVLAILKNDADYREIQKLQESLLALQLDIFNDTRPGQKYFIDTDLNKLGDLGELYQGFYIEFKANEPLIEKKSWLKLAGFIHDMNQLIRATQVWKEKNVLIAPISGTVNFSSDLKPLQNVNSEQELFTITQGNDPLKGEIFVSEKNLTKIKTGQKVLVPVNFSADEDRNHTLTGTITAISDSPNSQGFYRFSVTLNEPARNLAQRAHLRTGQQLYAELTTADVTLFSRLLNGATERVAILK